MHQLLDSTLHSTVQPLMPEPHTQTEFKYIEISQLSCVICTSILLCSCRVDIERMKYSVENFICISSFLRIENFLLFWKTFNFTLLHSNVNLHVLLDSVASLVLLFWNSLSCSLGISPPKLFRTSNRPFGKTKCVAKHGSSSSLCFPWFWHIR